MQVEEIEKAIEGAQEQHPYALHPHYFEMWKESALEDGRKLHIKTWVNYNETIGAWHISEYIEIEPRHDWLYPEGMKRGK